MGFRGPSWVPPASTISIPDSIPISEFILDEDHGRACLADSKKPFVWGNTGDGYNALEVDFFPLAWAVHRLSGIASLASTAYSVDELTHQLRASKVQALFTCLPLLDTALKAAANCGIPRSHVYLLDMPQDHVGNIAKPQGFVSVNKLIEQGSKLEELEPLKWKRGQAVQQCAYLCFSSGTSGLPKGVMISHMNVISQVSLFKLFESRTRTPDQKDTVLGLLPFNHLFGLAVFHSAFYRGESVVVLPKYELATLLEAIELCRINVLYVVPPIIIAMVKNGKLMKKHDLSSVRHIITGAAPLGNETAEDLHRLYPTWSILQAYGEYIRLILHVGLRSNTQEGLTETTAVATHTSPHDIFFGSSGCLLPLLEARLVTPDGADVEEYDTPGELLLRGPTIVLGYLNNEAANKETFQDGWLRTGDEAVFRKSHNGEDHVFIVDRIKELIKVKGFQVAPAELEAHLLTYPAVDDVAVIGVQDDSAGEVPKAFVVKASGVEGDDQTLIRDIQKHVQDHKAHYKWLSGGIEFIDSIPKSASGKILRRYLRDREREARRKIIAKL
ncbi:hypothetical protein UREG_03986 [Uncinocarpus reesii 1704]|uniref:Uncharacterized protein n=1 Tax=Uncinocarpus reesii (strain UAMH 1704) TaxID=336963 RepID=C4JMC8_UNCRE|nr:uncharacterized protein UREG_03986 [Uncinocarpus reesii 1704]EEP79140.1 hypothetical protein UREG_03986 [Uncinocarpus reesii 1704]